MLIKVGGNQCRNKETCKEFFGEIILRSEIINDFFCYKKNNIFIVSISLNENDSKIITIFDHEKDTRHFIFEILQAMEPNAEYNEKLATEFTIENPDLYKKESRKEHSSNFNENLVKELLREVQ